MKQRQALWKIFWQIRIWLSTFIRALPIGCCGVYDIKEVQNQYGLLKRRLKEFNKKLFRAVRSLADKIAREIRKKF
jgi:hypothetical protein